MKITNKQLRALYNTAPTMSLDEYIEYFKLLGDKVRHLICKEIFTKPGQTGKELLVKFHITQPTMSFHIKQLMQGGIIMEEKDGQSHLYYPNYLKILSFEKTNAVFHMELEGFLSDIYKSLVTNIIKAEDKHNK